MVLLHEDSCAILKISWTPLQRETCLRVDVDGILHQMTFFYCLLWVEYVYCRSRTSRFPTCREMYCKLRRAEWSWWNPWTVRSDFTWETYKWSLRLKLNVIDMKGRGGGELDLQCQNLIALDCEKKRCFILSPLYSKLSDRWPFPLAFFFIST